MLYIIITEHIGHSKACPERSRRNDEIKTPFEKLAEKKGRPMPEEFTLSTVTTGRSFYRTVDGHGRISWKRYRLYVSDISEIC
jgi:hypothetical protein